MITVACLLVRGPVAYSPEYVRRLFASCRRFLPRPFRFVCLTDRPQEMPAGVEAIAIDRNGHSEGYWSKVHLFNPAIGLRGRVLYIDLDNVPIAPLDPIADFPAPFALAGDMHAPTLDRVTYVQAGDGRQMVKRFNSGVMVFEGGAHRDLFDACTAETTRRYWTDQDWIAERYPDAAPMPVAWFPRLSLHRPPWSPEERVLFAKKPKPHEAVKMYPWFERVWGAA